MDELDKALAKHSTPEFETWWNCPSKEHKGQSMVEGTIETNGDFINSIWSNPWMEAHAAEIFKAGMTAAKKG